jgi:hypothetical protein
MLSLPFALSTPEIGLDTKSPGDNIDRTIQNINGTMAGCKGSLGEPAEISQHAYPSKKYDRSAF